MSKKISELTALTTETVELEDLYEATLNPLDGSPITRKLELRDLGGVVAAQISGGRLTSESGVPISVSDRTGQSKLYWTPFISNRLTLYGPSTADVPTWRQWALPEFGIEFGAGTGQLALASGYNYDMFAYTKVLTPSSTDTAADTVTFGATHYIMHGSVVQVSATGGGLTRATNYFARATSTTAISFHPTLADAFANTNKVNLTATITATVRMWGFTAAGWTNDTTRATALARQDGIWTLSGSAYALYLGTIRADGTNTFADSGGGSSSQVGGKRFMWNMYNRVLRPVGVIDTTNSWTGPSGGSWQQANAASGNKIEYVCGLAGAFVQVVALHMSYSVYGTSGGYTATAIGVDSTSTPSGVRGVNYPNSNTLNEIKILSGKLNAYQQLGYHYLAWLEYESVSSGLFYGDGGGSNYQSGLTGLLEC